VEFVADSINGGQQQGDQKAVPLYPATAQGMEAEERQDGICTYVDDLVKAM